MRKFIKLLVAAATPLMLIACLWSPGKFTSELTLRKNGTFTLDYKGEILFQLPDEKAKPEPWSDDMARCISGGTSQTDVTEGETRECAPAEVAAMKAAHDKREAARLESKRKNDDEMAKVFGLPGSDDASNRKFAATLMKYKGWRSVAYQGKGVFAVDYRGEGRLDQDVAFPMIPDSDLMLPFIALRRRADGSVLVTAPAFTGGSGPFGARAKMMGLPESDKNGPQSRAAGRFIIVTDGEILTNNSEDGAAPHAGGRQLKWDVDATSTKVPEALVKL